MNLPSTKIQVIAVEPGRRILALSDIHGLSSYLRNVLEKAQFCDDDILVIVGDMVVRGTDSLGTLRYVMELYERGNVIPLIGNVDAYWLHLIHDLSETTAADFYDYIEGFRSWSGTSFYDELASECGLEIDSPDALLSSKETVLAHFERELDFLTGLPTILETQNYVFVHGGLRDKELDANCLRSVFELTKYDSFMTESPHEFDKYVIVGHWPVNLYSGVCQQLNPVFDHRKRIIAIDGGCGIKRECQLNVLIIPDIGCSADEITWVSYDELPKIRALERQAGTEDSIHINWTCNDVVIIESEAEFSLAEHQKTGRQLYIPNTYIKNGGKCHDYSDRILGVEAGDELSLITKTSRGCIVKKNGIVGWYLGEYEE